MYTIARVFYSGSALYTIARVFYSGSALFALFGLELSPSLGSCPECLRRPSPARVTLLSSSSRMSPARRPIDCPPGTDLETCLAEFKSKFKSKTGYNWEDRDTIKEAKKNKYL